MGKNKIECFQKSCDIIFEEKKECIENCLGQNFRDEFERISQDINVAGVTLAELSNDITNYLILIPQLSIGPITPTLLTSLTTFLGESGVDLATLNSIIGDLATQVNLLKYDLAHSSDCYPVSSTTLTTLNNLITSFNTDLNTYKTSATLVGQEIAASQQLLVQLSIDLLLSPGNVGTDITNISNAATTLSSDVQTVSTTAQTLIGDAQAILNAMNTANLLSNCQVKVCLSKC